MRSPTRLKPLKKATWSGREAPKSAAVELNGAEEGQAQGDVAVNSCGMACAGGGATTSRTSGRRGGFRVKGIQKVAASRSFLMAFTGLLMDLLDL